LSIFNIQPNISSGSVLVVSPKEAVVNPPPPPPLPVSIVTSKVEASPLVKVIVLEDTEAVVSRS
jgi:hypothetical protein